MALLTEMPAELREEIENKMVKGPFLILKELDQDDVDLPESKIIAALIKASLVAEEYYNIAHKETLDRYDWIYPSVERGVCAAYVAWLSGAVDVDGWSIDSHTGQKLMAFAAFVIAVERMNGVESIIEDVDGISFSAADCLADFIKPENADV